jgi:Coenzyme PQQ synthesis protein D (PqqD)
MSEAGNTGGNEPRGDAGRLRPSADAVTKRVGDEVVLVQLRTNRIYTLNRTGARLWELLEDGHDLDGAGERLRREFDVGEDQLRDEMAALVDELVARKLLEPDANG